MKRLFRRLHDHIYVSAGLYRLADGFTTFAAVHTAFLIFTSLQGVFINTLFMRLTGNSQLVMYYNIITNCVAGPMMIASSLIARRTSSTFSMRTGILFHICMYITFFLSLHHLETAMPLIAALAGLGNGCYYFSYSYILNAFSTDESRDLAASIIGVLAGIVSLTVPALSGLVIAQFEGLTGYTVMFGVSLGMAIITILVSSKLAPVVPEDRQSHLSSLLRVIREGKLYKLILLGDFIKCTREGVCGFLFNVLLFEAITNEAIVGLNTLLAGVASILGAFIYGRLIGSKNRILSIGASSTILLLCASLLFIQLSPLTIILYSTLNAALGPFLMNPGFSICYQHVLGSEKSRQAMAEFIGVRECFIGLGRICGIIFTMLMPASTSGYVTTIVLLTAAQYLMMLLFRYVQNHHAREMAEAGAA
ncbi:MAG: MFS transporter [Provencibacterium sp.]|jgi:YQGE family putative transporter|nr:MFS transporter [Provencibacterium sp.]